MNGLRTISKSVVLFGLLFPFLASSVSSSSEETTINFSGTVKSGGNYLHVINKDIFFELKATKAGWEMAVRSKDRPKENLARLTPPVNTQSR